MKIRSITFFIDPCYPLDEARLKAGGDFIRIARPAFEAAGYEVQTARLATVPFAHLLPKASQGELARLAQELEAAAADLGYAYVSMGPALPEFPDSFSIVPDALAATQNVFFSGLMITTDGKVSLPAIRQCAQIIRKASTISADGFANLRFASLANVPPGSPFFPAAYQQGGEPSFALATEAADLAVMAFSAADSLEQGRSNLVKALEENGRKLAEVADVIESQSRVKFYGIDFSLAPFPEEARSIGTAFERLGVPVMGQHGSLAAAAILADTLDQANIKRTGFSGLLLPVLEDATLAKRAAEGHLGIMDLLLYSAVCGTGLDTLPLPGDTSVEALAAILVDLAALACRLGKPLTARLMPIPGKSAGDPISFDFAYFASSRVLPVRAAPLSRFLAGDEAFALHPRRVS